MENTDRTLALPSNFTHTVRIEELLPADSPRLNGLDEIHVERLVELYASLPPVLVHRTTMQVIDGMHRVAAAKRRGLETVEVQYFDGAREEAFIRAVAANVAHGLPLSTEDRKAAACRILGTHPGLSNRAIAACAGLDAKTVATIRRRSPTDSPRSNIRIGTDGRIHPLDRTTERLHAAELMTRHPDLPLRAIVKETGLSLGTAHDVRQRLLRGEEPVPTSRRRRPVGDTPPASSAAERAVTGGTAGPAPDDTGPGGAPARRAGTVSATHALSGRTRSSMETLRRLANDPSLRHSESGRHLLRWLHTHFIVDDAWRQRLEAVPPHCTATVSELALQWSQTWKRFADELSRSRLTDRTTPPGLRATSESRD
ncbi:transcriptional regulator [Streptomyces alkaliphilus]|uniref:Transcriptional regulator n=1 Tax=Streptomyces alkaliphilus TaxID=1472722 RepID=A0A7W3TAS1_9ACTN|nr:ParB N-terminal domain-containing protein [Streptomyces alkaliphilus]MBB0243376.1 transcriptional regulator [Streptomyces alkaliphilus]